MEPGSTLVCQTLAELAEINSSHVRLHCCWGPQFLTSVMLLCLDAVSSGVPDTVPYKDSCRHSFIERLKRTASYSGWAAPAKGDIFTLTGCSQAKAAARWACLNLLYYFVSRP